MVELRDTVAFVAGGAGQVGEGVVRAFLSRGARVAVPSRDPARNAALKARLGALAGERLLLLEGDVSRPEEAARLRDATERGLGAITAGVASVGGWWSGPPLTQVPLDTWRQILDRNVTSHLVLAQALLPALATRPGSSYTLINGTAAEEAVAGSSLASIAAAAHAMMARVLMAEHKGTQVRINLLVMGAIHTRAAKGAAAEQLTPDDVGVFCSYLASPEGRMVSGGVHHLVERPAPA